MTHQHRVRSAFFSNASSSICDEPPMPIGIHTRTHVQTVIFQDEMQPNSRARVVTQSLDPCQEHYLYMRKRVETPIAVQPKISELTVTLSDSAFAADVQSRSEIRTAKKSSLLILARKAASNVHLSLHVTPSSCCSELLSRPAAGHITTAAVVDLCSGAQQLPAERDDLSQLHNIQARASHNNRGMSSKSQRKLNKVDSAYYTVVKTPSKAAPADQLWQGLDASKATLLLSGASSDSTSNSTGRNSHDRVRYRDDSDSDVDYPVPDCASSIRSMCKKRSSKMAPSAMQGSQRLTRGRSLIAGVEIPTLLSSSRDTNDDSMPNIVSDSSNGSTGEGSSSLHKYGHTSVNQRQLRAQVVVGGVERVSVQKEALNATTASLQVDIQLLHQQLIALEMKMNVVLMQSNGGHEIKEIDPAKLSAPSLPARSFSGSTSQCQMSVAQHFAVSKSYAVREVYTSVSYDGSEDEVEDMRLMQKYGL